VGGSSIVGRKLVGKGAKQGARLFSYKSVSSSGRAALRCMHTVPVNSKLHLTGSEWLFLPTYCISQL